MDRVRAGLTGLGVVFLVTAAAALLFGPGPGDSAALELAKEPGEPLAQLGVAPSNENPEPQTVPAQPAPQPPGASATPSAREHPQMGPGAQERLNPGSAIARNATVKV